MKNHLIQWIKRLSVTAMAAALIATGLPANVLTEQAAAAEASALETPILADDLENVTESTLEEGNQGLKDDSYAGYVYVCFADLYPSGTSGEVDVQQVHFFLSRDGLNWTALNGCNAAFQAGKTWQNYLEPAASTKDSNRGINWEIKQDYWSDEYQAFKAGSLTNSAGEKVTRFNGDETKLDDPVSQKSVKAFTKYYNTMSEEALKGTTTGDASVLYPFEGNDQGIRDPYILRGAKADGSDADKIWILATDLNTQRQKYGSKAENQNYNTPTCGQWDNENGICGYSSPYMYVYETSDNFKTWTRRYIDLGSVTKLQETNPEINDSFRMVWAPEAIYNPDKNNYLVYWSAALYSEKANAAADRQIYCCETEDFVTFGPVRCYTDEKSDSVKTRLANKTVSSWAASIDASQLRVDPSGSYEKGTSYFYRLIKDESNLHCYLERSTDLINPDILSDGDTFADNVDPSAEYPLGVPIGNHYEDVSQKGLINYPNCEEGPTMFKFIDKDEWCIMVDYYGDMSIRYYPLTTTDLSVPESIKKLSSGYSRSNYEDKTKSGKQVQDIGCHGGMIPVTVEEYNSLIQVFNSDSSVTNYHVVDPIEVDKTSLESTLGKVEAAQSDASYAFEAEELKKLQEEGKTLFNDITASSKDIDAWIEKVNAALNKLTVSKTSVSLTAGESATVTATPLPSSAKVTGWSSSNTKVATVANGTIKAVEAGSAVITVSADNGCTATVNVTVKAAASLSVNTTALTLKVGETKQIGVTAGPAGTSVTYFSNNTKAAKVSAKGVVTAVGAGNATITVKASNGLSKSVKVTVKKPSLIIKASSSVKRRKTIQLKATLKNLKGTVKWSITSGKKLVKLNKKSGTSVKLTAKKKKGSVTVKAVCGGVSATKKIKVK